MAFDAKEEHEDNIAPYIEEYNWYDLVSKYKSDIKHEVDSSEVLTAGQSTNNTIRDRTPFTGS